MPKNVKIMVDGKTIFDEDFESIDFNQHREVIPIYKKAEPKPILVPSKKHKLTLLCATSEDPHSEFFTTV